MSDLSMTTTARKLPTCTLTFFFSDIEGSTGLLQRLGIGYKDVLERHAQIVRRHVDECGGVEVSTEGDSFFVAFPSASGAVRAAAAIQQDLGGEPWPAGGTVAIRIGLHTGTAELGHDNYIGIDINRAARISAAGHGGQVVVSGAVRAAASTWRLTMTRSWCYLRSRRRWVSIRRGTVAWLRPSPMGLG
jgi:class 3 adenylate cyclase